MVNEIKDGKFDKSYFVNSKALSREYTNPDAQCHFSLATRLMHEKGMVFLSNERIPYLILYDLVKTHAIKCNLSEVVGHPDFLQEND